MAARAFLGALTLVGSLLGQGFFEHFLAQGCRALGLLLRIAQQLTELLFLFLIELVGLGAKELAFQIGNDRLGFGQLLRLLREFLLRLRQSCSFRQLPAARHIPATRPDYRPTPAKLLPASSSLERLPKAPPQRIEINVFDRHLHAGVPILARPPRRRSHPLPVGRTIHRAPETLPFDKGLQQHDRMPIFGLPVPRDPARHLAQDPTAQMRHSSPRANQKARVVGHQRQVAFAVARPTSR